MKKTINYDLLAISGSLRQASFNSILARNLSTIAPKNFSINTMTLHEIPHYNADEDGNRLPQSINIFRNAISICDGLILVSPEYNYGMPGVLKNALDWASRPAFNSVLKGKPVLIITASPSPSGGTRAYAQIRDTVAATLSRVVVRKQVTIGNIQQKLIENRISDPDTIQVLQDALNDLMQEINIVRSVNGLS